MKLNLQSYLGSAVIVFSTSCLMLGSQAVMAQERPVTSIREQLDIAREFDPEYASAVATREAAEQALLRAQAGKGLQVTFSASSFHSNRKEENETLLGTTEVDRRIKSHIANIQARQPLYRKRANTEIEQAKASLEAARELALAADQDLQNRLLSAWFEVLAIRDQIQAQEKAVAAADETFLEADRRRSAGESTAQDLDIAQARLMQTQALLVNAQAQLEIADQKLRNLAGPRALVPPEALMQGLGRFVAEVRPAQDLRDLISTKNYEVRSLRFQEEVARFEREKARADKYPTIDAYAMASKGDNDTVSSIKDEQRIGLQMSVPLYTSGAISAAVAEADANYRKTQARTRAVTLRVEAEALSANIRLQALSKVILATQRSVQAALLMVRATEKGVRSGVSSRAEVASNLQELAATQRQLAALRADYLNSSLLIEKSVSALTVEQLEKFESLSKLPLVAQ